MAKKIVCIMMIMCSMICLHITTFAANESCKLYFSASDGKLYYSNETTGLNNFLNFQNMYPGQTYSNELEISNQTNKTYDLYFQIEPIGSLPENLELLSKIKIKLYYDNAILYEGTADKIFPNAQQNPVKLDMVSLGKYVPNQTKTLKAEVVLSDDYWSATDTQTLYYSMDANGEYTIESNTKPTNEKYKIVEKSINNNKSQVAKTTWKFYAQDDTTGGGSSEYHDITYIAQEGGYISGVEKQQVLRYSSGTKVVAIAKDGYKFIGWDDGLTDAQRQEVNVTRNMVFVAKFEKTKTPPTETTSPPTETTSPPTETTNPPTETANPPTESKNPPTDNPNKPENPLIPIVPPKTGDFNTDIYVNIMIVATAILVVLVVTKLNKKKSKTKRRLR